MNNRLSENAIYINHIQESLKVMRESVPMVNI